MALIAVSTVVHVSVHMRVIETRCVVVPVASGALEHRVVARIRMTGRAHAVRVAMIQVEIRVVECGTRPVRRLPGGVARVARRGEAR